MTEQRHSTPVQRSPRSRRNLALLLIGAGIIIFLSNTGVIGSAAWDVLWPLALVAVGIDLITSGQQRRRVVLGALIGAVVLIPLVSGARLLAPNDGPAPSELVESRIELTDVQRVQADISQTAGNLSIRPLPEDSPDLALLEEGGELQFSRNGQVGQLRLDTAAWSGGDIDLQLTRRLPLELILSITAGNAEPIDLRDVQIQRLNLSVGGGNAEVRLPAQGVYEVNIDSVAGNVEIEVPSDVATRIQAESGFANIDVTDRFQQQNGVYVSEDYNENAPNRVNIVVTASAGNIEIR